MKSESRVDGSPIQFFVGLDRTTHAKHFDRSFISVNTLKSRRSDFEVRKWIMDSGAYSEITNHGRHRLSVGEYAEQCDRWARVGDFQRAAIQDYMCEPHVLKITGLTVRDHQRLTIERYDQLRAVTGVALLPVLQGFQPWEYIEHIEMYEKRLTQGMWVGVGSVCRRNNRPEIIEDILLCIKRKRPDLRLHGFGLKVTSLRSPIVRQMLYSADSMAWCYAAFKAGRDNHNWNEAKDYENRVNSDLPTQPTAKQIPIWT